MKSEDRAESDLLSVDGLRELLAPAGIGRRAAYALARQLGQRVGQRKLVVSRKRVEQWLAGERGAGA